MPVVDFYFRQLLGLVVVVQLVPLLEMAAKLESARSEREVTAVLRLVQLAEQSSRQLICHEAD